MKTFCIVLLAAFVQLNLALPSPPLIQPSFSIDPYILNGEEAKIGEFPHQLMLEKDRGTGWKYSCGAVLINAHQALTAAHCIDGDLSKGLRIIAGAHNKFQRNDTQIVRIKRSIKHPKYNDASALYSNDIAMLTFATPVVLTSKIQPIIWNYNETLTFAADRCVLSGWGRTTTGNPKFLQKVKMNIISNQECANKYEIIAPNLIYPGHICAYEPMFGTCHGDSGGPMTCQYEGRAMLVGLLSWGMSDSSGCKPIYPSVYARVSYFEKFIRNNLFQ